MKPYFDATLNVATREQANAAVDLACHHSTRPGIAMRSSAQSCADDAAKFFAEGRYGYAHEWAVESLRYSVGIMHPDYIRLQKERR